MTNDSNNMAALSKLQRISIGCGAIGLVLCGLGAVLNLSQMLHSYLFGFVVCWSIIIGCLGITMITHLVHSNWGRASRPYFAAGVATLPLAALLFLPVALGVGKIYTWAGAAHGHGHHQSQASDENSDADAQETETSGHSAHEISEQKKKYLNPSFFWLRACGYFLVWLGLGVVLSRSSVVYRRGDQDANAGWLRCVSGVGLGFTVLTATFAAIDWIMSLDPHWYSTIFGGVICAAGVVSAMAIVVLAMGHLGVDFTGVKTSDTHVLADLGSLLLGFVMIWTYFAFSQYLIIWSGDQPSEASWYLLRTKHGWQWIALLIVAFHFAVPFILLLSRDRKRNVKVMTRIALMLLAIHVIDFFWNVKPAFSPTLSVHWMDMAALLGVGGIWLACGIWQLKRQIAAATGTA